MCIWRIWWMGENPGGQDAHRLKRLRANCQTAGAGDIVRAKCEDFLSLDPASPEYAGVRAVLLDPSCSGGARNHIYLHPHPPPLPY